MLLTDLFFQCLFIFINIVEVNFFKYLILIDDLIEDANVERKSFRTFKLLDKFSTNRAAHSISVMELRNAFGAQSVTAVDQHSWNPLSYVVLETAELADIKAARLVIKVLNV